MKMPEVVVSVDVLDRLVEAMHPADRFVDLEDPRETLVLWFPHRQVKLAGVRAMSKKLNMTDIELKPCPWCGDFDDLWLRETVSLFAFTCPTCQVIGPYGETPDEAAEIWNRRARGCDMRDLAEILDEY